MIDIKGPWRAQQIDLQTWNITDRHHDLIVCVTGNDPIEAAGTARRLAALPALVDELMKAHQILQNGLNIMTTTQKLRWAKKNAADRVEGEGVIRANERVELLHDLIAWGGH